MNNQDMTAMGDMTSDDSEEMDAAMASAGEADSELNEMADTVAPEGKYSADILNVLVDAVNALLPLFDKNLPLLSPVEADVVGPLPTELVKAITMVNAATTDADMPDLTPDLTSMVDDRGVRMTAAKLQLLAKNRDFKMFLSSPMKMTDEAPVKAAPASAGPAVPSDDEMDKLFKSRM